MPKQNATQGFDLGLYLQEINEYPLLTATQEVELARRIEQGDYEAREALINSNLRLVVNIARRYINNSRKSLPDLINDGNLGLVQAAGRFRPEEFKTKFSTYAAWWIKQSIRHSILNGGWPMRVPAYMYTILVALKRAGITTPEDLESPEGLAVFKRLRGNKSSGKKTISQIKKAMVAMDCGLVEGPEDGSSDVLMEQDSGEPQPDSLFDNRESVETLLNAVAHGLDDRERQVIKRRYGLGCKAMTLRELGAEMGLTRERVRQIEGRAIKKLQELLLVA